MSNLFNGAGRHSAQNEGHAQRCGGEAHGDLGIGVNNVLHSDGTQKNGCGQSVAEEFDGEVTLGNVAQHARDNPPAIEGGEVGAGGPFAGGASGNVVVGLRGENFGGLFLEVCEWDWDREFFPREAELVDLELAPHAGAGGVGVGDGVGRIGHGPPRASSWSGDHSIRARSCPDGQIPFPQRNDAEMGQSAKPQRTQRTRRSQGVFL